MARMHEILRVEPGEMFEFEARGERVKFRIDAEGNLFRETMDHRRIPSPREVVEIINNTERIIRKPRLTYRQKIALTALANLGFIYLTMDSEGYTEARDMMPKKFMFTWAIPPTIVCHQHFVMHKMCNKDLAGLVSWDDPKPLDIIQTLKDNNVEV